MTINAANCITISMGNQRRVIYGKEDRIDKLGILGSVVPNKVNDDIRQIGLGSTTFERLRTYRKRKSVSSALKICLYNTIIVLKHRSSLQQIRHADTSCAILAAKKAPWRILIRRAQLCEDGPVT